MVNTHMIMGTIYERMGIGPAPKTIASKPLLSFILENLGHIPHEDESLIYENLEITPKTFDNGRVLEAIIHILEDEDIAEDATVGDGEEVMA